MSEWVETTLGELATFQNGYPFKPIDLNGSIMPVIRIKQLLDPQAAVDSTDMAVPEKFRIGDGDLIFSWSATLASVLWDRGPAYLNQHLFRVTERASVDRQWLHYALDDAIGDLEAKSHGTTMKHVTKKVLLAHPTALPPLAEQRRIVDVMAAVDAQIAALEAEAAHVERTCHAMLTMEAFGGPAWPRYPFPQVIDFREGPGIMARDFRDAGVPLIRLAGLTPGESILTKCNYLDPAKVDKKWSHFRVELGDVLLSTSAALGRVAVVDAEGVGAIPYTGIIRMRPASEMVEPHYIPWLLRSADFSNQIFDAGVGTTMAHFGPTHLRKMTVPLPPVEKQRDIAEKLQGVYSAQLASAEVIAHLRVFRSTLLSALLNQEIEIPESYDRFLERVS